MLIITADYPYTFEYLIKYFFTFCIAIRIQSITIIDPISYSVACLFLFLLINTYSYNEHRRFYLTILLVVMCYLTTFTINCLYSFALIPIILICPLIPGKRRLLKFGLSSLIFMIPIIMILIIQKLDKQAALEKYYEKVVLTLITFNENYLNIFEVNVINFLQDILQNNQIYEFDLLKNILEYLINLDL